jgi:predicted nucleotidyltransferase
MVGMKVIEQVVQRLVAAGGVRKIILFGSYARGDATEDSDLDFIVVEDHLESKIKEMARLNSVIDYIGIGVDILIYTPEELADLGDIPGTAVYWALKEGKVLYE